MSASDGVNASAIQSEKRSAIIPCCAAAEQSKEIGLLPAGSSLVLREVFLRGEIPRGDVGRIVGVSSRTGQKMTGTLLSLRLLGSPTPKAPLRLSFPSDAAAYYCPNLYPAGVD
jgi:hypothetical protein